MLTTQTFLFQQNTSPDIQEYCHPKYLPTLEIFLFARAGRPRRGLLAIDRRNRPTPDAIAICIGTARRGGRRLLYAPRSRFARLAWKRAIYSAEKRKEKEEKVKRVAARLCAAGSPRAGIRTRVCVHRSLALRTCVCTRSLARAHVLSRI